MATQKPSTAPAFQFYPKDFLMSPKVRRMSLAERGAYITLLSMCWLDGTLPNDHTTLASDLHIPVKQFDRMWQGELGKCFTEKHGRLTNRRLEDERTKQEEYRRRAADFGRKGGRPKKGSERVALSNPLSKQKGQESSPISDLRSPISDLQVQPPTGVVSRARGILHDTSHKHHAHCGRICLHASLFEEFIRRRHHDGARAELDAWANDVEKAWGPGGPRASEEPGDPFDFWRARYDERWPAAPAALTRSDSRTPEWVRKARQAVHQ